MNIVEISERYGIGLKQADALDRATKHIVEHGSDTDTVFVSWPQAVDYAKSMVSKMCPELDITSMVGKETVKAITAVTVESIEVIIA